MKAERMTADTTSPHLKRVVVAGAIGNFVQWYDFVIYGYLAVVLGRNFFPADDPTAGLLSTFAVFAVAFLVRPIGGIFFGRIGDRVGRRPALAAVILLESGATALIGLLPTYAAIGVGASLLLLIVRCVQGFATGGEWAGAAVFVVEHAGSRKRGLIASSLPVTASLALISGATLVTALSSLMSDAAFDSWGWRIPFLIALPLGLVGMYLRIRMTDTPAFQAVEESNTVSSAPFREAVRANYRPILVLFGFFITNAAGYYTLFTYLPTYFQVGAELSVSVALLSSIVAQVLFCCFLVMWAFISDRVGRKPVMILSCVLFIALPAPAFLLINQDGLIFLILGQVLLALALAGSEALTAVLMVEMFSTRMRYTSGGLSYNFAYVIFGGTAPYLNTWLVDATGTSFAPTYYIMALAAISLVVVAVGYRETYRLPLLREGDVSVTAKPGFRS